MGAFSITPPSASPSPSPSTKSSYEKPTYSAGTKKGQTVARVPYQQPGIPAQLSAEQQLGGWEGLMGTVDTAARGPAYVYERPLAWANTLMSEVFGSEQEDGNKSNPLTDLTKGVPRIPVVGDVIDSVSAGTSNLFGFSQGSIVAHDAWLAKNIWNAEPGTRWGGGILPQGDVFESLAAHLNAPSVSLADTWEGYDVDAEKQRLIGLGWTDEDIRAMERGEKSIFDFPEKRLSNNIASDIVAKFALDPTNLIFGAGVAMKGAKFADWAINAVQTYNTVTRGGQAAAKAGMTSSAFAETMMGALLTKGDKALKAYRNYVAIPSTAVQVGANAISEIAPGVKDIPHIGGFFDIAEKVGNNKPLSQNDLFMVASLLNFPVRHYIAEGYKKTVKNPLKRNLGVELEHEMIRVLTPDMERTGRASNWAARKEAAMKIVGETSEEGWRDVAAQVMRQALNDKYELLSVSGRTLMDEFKSKNLGGLMFQARQMQKRTADIIRMEFEEGFLTTQDIRRAMMDTTRGGKMKQMTGGLDDVAFTPEAFGAHWQAWKPVAQELSEIFGGAGSPLVPAISDKLLTHEGLDWMTYRLRDAIDIKGTNTLTRVEVRRILQEQPAIFKASKSAEVQKLLSDRYETVDAAEIIRALSDDAVRERAVLMEEWTAPLTTAEDAALRAGRRVDAANSMLDNNQQLAPDHAPEYGAAEAVVLDTEWQGTRVGVGQHTDQMRAMRADPRVAKAESALSIGLRDAGLPVESAMQVGAVDGKVATSALSIRLNGAADRTTLETAAVIAMDATEAKRVMVIRRGENELLRHGERANAAEFVWDPGRRLDVQELDEVTAMLRQKFGDRVIVNDTTGVVRVIVRDDSPVAKLDTYINQVNDRLGVEPVQSAVNVQDIVRGGRTINGYTTTLASATRRAKLGRRYWDAESRVSRRLVEPDMGRRDDLAGGRPAVGPTEQPPGRGGSGAYREPDSRFITRYEAQRGTTPRGGEPQYAVPSEALGEFRQRAQLASDGRRVTVPRDAKLFQLPGGEAGAWVHDGTLRIWANPKRGRSIDAELNDLIAEASEHATVTRIRHTRTAAGSPVDIWGDHGWRVVGRTRSGSDEFVTLIRDVEGLSGLPEIPPRYAGQGGYQALRESGQVTNFRSLQSVDANARAIESRLYPDGVTEHIPGLDGQAADIASRHTFTEIDEMLRMDPQNIALHRAKRIARRKEGVEFSGEPTGNVAFMESQGFTWHPEDGWVHPDRPAFIGPEPHLELRNNATYTRLSGRPRTPAQRARTFSRAAGRIQRQEGRMFDKLDDVIEHPESRHYLDSTGQTGALVSPEGELKYFFRAQADDAMPIEDLLRNVERDGFATHAVVPDYAIPAAERAGMVVVATADGQSYMTWANRLRDDFEGPIAAASPGDAAQWVTANLKTRPSAARAEAIAAMPWDGGAVKYIHDVQEELAEVFPRLDIDPKLLNEMSPEQLRKVRALQAQLLEQGSPYVISHSPAGAVPYFEGQGGLLADIFDSRSVLENVWLEGLRDVGNNVLGKVFNPVYSRELAEAQRQAVYEEFLAHGVTAPQANKFLERMYHEWNTRGIRPAGLRLTSKPTMMSPWHIRAIAAETLPTGAIDRIVASGDDVFDIMQRSGSRFYRGLQEKFPVIEGKGNLGKVIEYVYGKGELGGVGTVVDKSAVALRRGIWAGKIVYHIGRFLADPRWIAMNAFEADILAFGRAGRGPTGVIPKARARIAGTQRMEGPVEGVAREADLVRDRAHSTFTDLDDVLLWDAAASGWLDPRNVQGYVSDAFAVESQAMIREQLLRSVKAQDDAYRGMSELFGVDTSPETWIEGLEAKLRGFDELGVEGTVLPAAAADGLRMGENALIDDFLNTLVVKNRQVYRDVMHTFHGNVNRSNIERLANSPFLYWPISYQLKAGKWMLDMLTKQVGGAKTDMLGMGYLNYLLTQHNDRYEADATYRAAFDDHPWLWRTLGMMLPMTPMDMGVYMARWTRYSADWLATELGLSERNPYYPPTLGDFLDKSTRLGPLFTADLIKYLAEELTGE